MASVLVVSNICVYFVVNQYRCRVRLACVHSGEGVTQVTSRRGRGHCDNHQAMPGEAGGILDSQTVPWAPAFPRCHPFPSMLPVASAPKPKPPSWKGQWWSSCTVHHFIDETGSEGLKDCWDKLELRALHSLLGLLLSKVWSVFWCRWWFHPWGGARAHFMGMWSVQSHRTCSWFNALLLQSWNLLILFEQRTSHFPFLLGPTNYIASAGRSLPGPRLPPLSRPWDGTPQDGI